MKGKIGQTASCFIHSIGYDMVIFDVWNGKCLKHFKERKLIAESCALQDIVWQHVSMNLKVTHIHTALFFRLHDLDLPCYKAGTGTLR